jgi:hypothetical protein
MRNIGKKYLQFCDNQILWLMGESSYNIRLFLLLVKNHVKLVNERITEKVINREKKSYIPFFSCNICNTCEANKNNGLAEIFLPSWRGFVTDSAEEFCSEITRTTLGCIFKHRIPP